MNSSFLKKIGPFLWDAFCLTSLVGIWPRFIEPRLIFTSKLNFSIANLHKDLNGFKILQISDIHLNQQSSSTFLNKLVQKIKALSPDLIVMTGDFICYSQLDNPEKLQSLLQQFKAPYGCFAILGNHDYASFVSINENGDYDVITPPSSSLSRAFSRLIEPITLTKNFTERAKNISFHQELIDLLKLTPFRLLHNVTEIISVKNAKLNISGLGEYCLGKTDPQLAFKDYNHNYPGIILLHNPDGISLLKTYPGSIILSGHSHGGQVNLPWMWKKFTLLENMNFKRGLKKWGNKWLYINRGLGSVLPFRWFAPPEILLLTLQDKA
jgi:predicted MPP superfamily phosphohydrolase